jgi:hypothetical protein
MFTSEGPSREHVTGRTADRDRPVDARGRLHGGAQYARPSCVPRSRRFPATTLSLLAHPRPSRAGAAAGDSDQAARPHAEQLRLRNAAVIGGGILLVGAYGAAKWWQDGFTGISAPRTRVGSGRTPHPVERTSSATLFPHTWGRDWSRRAFNAVGNEPEPARRLAAWSTLAVMLGIEVLDGYSKRVSVQPRGCHHGCRGRRHRIPHGAQS